MITREEYIESLKQEFKILKHLHSKILPGTENFRFSDNQRSILELMQYLSISTIAGLECILVGNGSPFQEYGAKSKETTLENFVEKIDEQEKAVEETFAKLTDEELQKSADLWNMGAEERKGSMLISLVLKGITAYRLQLFTLIKASGRGDIGTSDAWRGMDSK